MESGSSVGAIKGKELTQNQRQSQPPHYRAVPAAARVRHTQHLSVNQSRSEIHGPFPGKLSAKQNIPWRYCFHFSAHSKALISHLSNGQIPDLKQVPNTRAHLQQLASAGQTTEQVTFCLDLDGQDANGLRSTWCSTSHACAR